MYIINYTKLCIVKLLPLQHEQNFNIWFNLVSRCTYNNNICFTIGLIRYETIIINPPFRIYFKRREFGRVEVLRNHLRHQLRSRESVIHERTSHQGTLRFSQIYSQCFRPTRVTHKYITQINFNQLFLISTVAKL